MTEEKFLAQVKQFNRAQLIMFHLDILARNVANAGCACDCDASCSSHTAIDDLARLTLGPFDPDRRRRTAE